MSHHTGTTYEFNNIVDGSNAGRTFRIFVLYPGSQDSNLEGELLTWRYKGSRSSGSDDDPPEATDYDALSYHWGPVTENDPVVYIQTKATRHLRHTQLPRIQVTENLATALRSLRGPTYKKIMWIDALCINQRHQEEKSSQISNMSVIFSAAVAVRIWLGPEEDDAKVAFDFVQKCLANDEFDKAMKDPHASKDLKALVSLMKRPWFSRRWIVQEIAMAKTATLHCGKQCLEWQAFADVISQLSSKQYEIQILFKQSPEFKHHADYLGDISELGAIRLVEMTEDLFYKTEDNQVQEKKFTLEALMSTMSAFEASVAHDIVYAVLWLANDAHGVAVMQRDVSVPASPSIQSPLFPGYPPLRTLPEHPQDSQPHARRLRNPSVKYHQLEDAPRSERQHGDIPSIQVDSAQSHDQASTSPDQLHYSDEQSTVQATGPHLAPREEANATSTLSASNSPQGIQVAVAGKNLLATGRKRTLSLADAGNDEMERTRIAFGMFKNGLAKSRIHLDYGKSIFAVCKEVLEFTIRGSKSLDILCRPWAPNDPNDDKFPSWIPRLSDRVAFKANRKGQYRRVNADPLLGKFEPSGPSYRASNKLTYLFKYEFFQKDSAQERSLLIRGLLLHTIATTELKSNATSGTIPSDWRTAVQWNDDSSLPDQFWRTLVGNRDAHGRRAPLYWRRACSEAFEDAPKDDDLETTHVLSGDPASRVREFLQRVQGVVWNRKLVRMNLRHMTRGPTLCLVPKVTQADDLICILYGCNVPVVLRRKDGSGRFRLLGECYVHGIMDGEAYEIRSKMAKESGDKVVDDMFELI